MSAIPERRPLGRTGLQVSRLCLGTMKAIIHRGVDGHHQLMSGEHHGLRENLLDIFKTLRDPYVA